MVEQRGEKRIDPRAWINIEWRKKERARPRTPQLRVLGVIKHQQRLSAWCAMAERSLPLKMKASIGRIEMAA